MEDLRDNDHDHDQYRDVSRPSGGPRWNPTKEQINTLESLYREGIRTPSAEQIQKITTRLRAFGHIEGKNVFYWFQNHKARQRQKQKQHTMAHINRFLHRSSPTTTLTRYSSYNFSSYSLPECDSVICGPYYVPLQTQGDPIGRFHQQHQQNDKSTLSSAARFSNRLQKFQQRTRIVSTACGARYDRVLRDEYTVDFGGSSGTKRRMLVTGDKSFAGQETLPLFPLSPTGDPQRKDDQEEYPDHHDQNHDLDHDDNNADDISTIVATDYCEVEEGCSSSGGDQRFYDFFSP